MENKNTDFVEFLLSKTGRIVMIAAMYLVIFLLEVFFIGVLDSEILGLILAALLGYFGWQSLNRIRSDIFLFMPIVGWVVYFIFKGILSILIGIFVAPFVIAKKITAAIQGSI